MEKDNNNMTKYAIGVLFLGALMVGLLFIGTSSDHKFVETGDTVEVEYTGKLMDGTIFDTSDPDVANTSGTYDPMRPYQPLTFEVGRRMVIEGFDNGVLGMKEGEKKRLTIPPEQAYGPTDPTKIQELPLTDEWPLTQAIPKEIEIPREQFNITFGSDHVMGDSVQLPESTVNMTIVKINGFVNLSIDVDIGDSLSFGQTPWEEEVIEMNSTHIIVNRKVKVDDLIQFSGTPWNSTVIEVSDTSFVIKHNPIPDQDIQTPYGLMSIHFNETCITMDTNPPLAGKTLIFDIEILEIEKAGKIDENIEIEKVDNTDEIIEIEKVDNTDEIIE